jgi:putative thioredoxin
MQMLDTTQAGFTRDVIDASREWVVLVDFWAPWCGPCRALSPLLASIEAESGGRLRVVKVNVDESPELSARYGVRSIPYVVAFVDGRNVDSFVGALPAPELRKFVGRLLPDPAEIERRKAKQLLDQGKIEAAASALRAAIALDPRRDATRLDLAQLLLEHSSAPDRLEEAAANLDAVSAAGRLDSRCTALMTRLSSLRRAADLPGVEVLASRLESNPGDLVARLDLANLHLANGRLEAALEQLLAIAERDRNFGDDVGRRTMLSVFEMAADQPQLVSSYRRRLAAALNR